MGELPSHVLVLQDNKDWIIENAQKQKSAQQMAQQQQQLNALSKLLLPNGNESVDTMMSMIQRKKSSQNGDDDGGDSESHSDDRNRDRKRDRDRDRRRHRRH